MCLYSNSNNMAEPTKLEKKLSPNTSSDLNSANSSFSIIDPNEVSKENEESKASIPFAFLNGERDLFTGNTVDGFAVLTNYRFYHKGYATDYHINVPLGLVARVETSGLVLFIFCKNGRSYSLSFFLKEVDIWKAEIQSKLNHLEPEACFAFSHFLGSSQNNILGSSTSNGKTAASTEPENMAAVDGKDADCDDGWYTVNGDSGKSENGTASQKPKTHESNGNGASFKNLDAKGVLADENVSLTKYEEVKIEGDTWLLSLGFDFENSLLTKEAKRMQFHLNDVWRISVSNQLYGLCPSYPRQIITPNHVSDLDLLEVAKYRRMKRVPAVVWRHQGNGRVIARCSQPSTGLLGYKSVEDQKLIAAIGEACSKDTDKESSPSLLIVDARSEVAAWGNRLSLGGHEDVQCYSNCEIEFMGIANIHRVRDSLDAVALLCATPDRAEWLVHLDGTCWMSYISIIIGAAVVIVQAIHDDCRPVLVHCSDGWDRTSQLSALAQLMLDPFYRTVEGFEVLVEREWLEFGHKFADRCGHWNSEKLESERSPIFLQWLDCVFQLMQQFPFHFEFNEQYLIRLVIHTYSCLFGTFFCNTDEKRQRCRLNEKTLSLWPALRGVKEFYNELYCKNEEVLRPSCQIRNLKFWSNLYLQNSFIHHNTLKMFLPNEESESKNDSNDPPKRKTSSPKKDIDPAMVGNPLETSDIPEIPDPKLEDLEPKEVPEEEETDQSSGPLDMLGSILPNLYNMYESLYNLVPSFPFYGGEPPKKDRSVVWMFENKKREPEEPAKVLDFDGLFVQDDFVSVVARKFLEKNKVCSCTQHCQTPLPESDS